MGVLRAALVTIYKKTGMEVPMRILRGLMVAAAMVCGTGAAHAQTATPQQIQGMIAAGQEQAALSALHAALQAHPDSGVAWYLTAEAQDAAGHEATARTALAKAEQFAPGLPFAQPGDVAQLQAHLNATATGAAPAAHGGSGASPVVFIIGAVVVFLLFRMLFRRRRVMGYQPGYGEAYPGRPGAPMPYGPGGVMPYGPGGGSGVGGSLMSGLAAGAGFAVGERVVDDIIGGGMGDRGIVDQPVPGIDPGQVPSWDDGLNGAPGWDNGGGTDDNLDNGGGFDPNNNW
jgi:hypothetical protein